jgi:peptidoglycan/LPS O-acetylase OafA/YrhL
VKHYRNLDWLRLFFALSVPFWHGWNATGQPLSGLFFAVPAFLALSGFVVLQSYERSRSPGHFFWKRMLRVGPAFIASFALVAALFGLAAVLPTFESWYTFGLHSERSRNSVLWSLSCEEVAYISLAIAYGLGVYKRPLLLWMGIGVFMLPGLFYEVHGPVSRQLHNLPSAFLIGNLFYVYRDRIHTKPWVPLIAMVAMLALLPFRGNVGAFQFVHQSALIASFLWFGIAGAQIPMRLPFDISYGTYIYHLPILAWLLASGMQQRWPLIGACYAITIPLALISWFTMERRFLALKDKVPGWRPRKPEPLPEAEPASEHETAAASSGVGAGS